MNPAPAPQLPVRDLTALEDEITELAAHLNAATYRLLTLIAEFDQRSGWSGAGLKSCAHWLNWYIDDDGSYVFKGRLSPEQGARIVQVLDAAVVAIREEQRNTAEDVSAETPIAAHRADALERVADNYLANDQAAVNGGDRCTVHIHTDMKTLRADGGEPVFSTPKGDMIPPGPETRFSGNVFALTTANRRQQLDIGPRTLVPRWYGEEMDDAMAIDGLLRRE